MVEWKPVLCMTNTGVEHQEVVTLLIAAGADLNIGDKDGVTALQHAKSRGYKAIVKMLEQAGAK